MTQPTKTVRFSELVAHHNFIDQTFQVYVRKWMDRNMVSIPLGMLVTDDTDRWEIEADEVFEHEEVEVTEVSCDECGEQWHFVGCSPIEEKIDCGCRVLDDEGEETDQKSPRTVKEIDLWVVKDTDYAGDPMVEAREGGDHIGITSSGEEVALWILEEEAEQFASEKNEEHQQESMYGFPWAHGWAFMPDSFIETSSLKAAGFRVAQYTGGNGHWRDDEQYRLCGIDGGGYDFASVHFAKLVAVHSESREHTVETDQGSVYVTTDERSDLEKLADAAEEEE